MSPAQQPDITDLTPLVVGDVDPADIQAALFEDRV
jgi:hypothetical protein